ncbi:MAG: MHFG family PEP-CTERM protein [Caldimonas sp.]
MIAALALAAALTPASLDCSWDAPGADRYTGRTDAAIMALAVIPESARRALIAKADRHDFDEVVYIDRDAIRGKASYDPEIRYMAFGSRGKVCETVSRAKWAPEQVETAMVYCAESYCVAVPSICGNVFLLTRRPDEERPPAAVVPPETFETPVAPPVAAAPPMDAAPPATFTQGCDCPPGGGGGGGGGYVVFVGGGGGGGGFYPTPPVTPIGPVTPIPEPSTWALLAAGLGIILTRAAGYRSEYAR